MSQEENIVVDHGRSQWSDLWKKEDFSAIWLGFAIILVCLVAYFVFGPKAQFSDTIAKEDQVQAQEAAKAPFKTVAWYKADDAKKKLKASKSSSFGKFVSSWTKHPGAWKSNPMDAFVVSEERAAALNKKGMPEYEAAKTATTQALAMAMITETAASIAQYKSDSLNQVAVDKISDWRKAHTSESKAKKKVDHQPFNIIPSLIELCIFLGIVFGFGTKMMGNRIFQRLFLCFFGCCPGLCAWLTGNFKTIRYWCRGLGGRSWDDYRQYHPNP